MTVANNASLYSAILVVFLQFIPVDRAKISHMNTRPVPVTEPARLPGSYEEALRLVTRSGGTRDKPKNVCVGGYRCRCRRGFREF